MSLESKFYNYMGNLSFGMYAYHTAIIAILISVLTNYTDWHQTQPVLFNGLLYLGSLGLTIVVSALSYRYLEGYFLTLKKKFRQVKHTEAGTYDKREKQIAKPSASKKQLVST